MLIGRLSQMSPPPCLYDTVIQSYVQLKSGSIERTAHFMGRPTPLKVNGANFSTSCPPGVQLLPHFEVWSYRACQPLQMWPIHISVKSTLWATRHQIFFRNVKSMGQLWDAPAPQGCTFTHFEVWSYRACQPLQMWQISNFCEIHSLSYEASKFFRHVKSMRLILPLFCPWGKHRTPDRL